MIKFEYWIEAVQILNNMKTVSTEQDDYIWVQKLNIEYRQNKEEFVLSNDLSQELDRIANQNEPLSIFAKNLKRRIENTNF